MYKHVWQSVAACNFASTFGIVSDAHEAWITGIALMLMSLSGVTISSHYFISPIIYNVCCLKSALVLVLSFIWNYSNRHFCCSKSRVSICLHVLQAKARYVIWAYLNYHFCSLVVLFSPILYVVNVEVVFGESYHPMATSPLRMPGRNRSQVARDFRLREVERSEASTPPVVPFRWQLPGFFGTASGTWSRATSTLSLRGPRDPLGWSVRWLAQGAMSFIPSIIAHMNIPVVYIINIPVIFHTIYCI